MVPSPRERTACSCSTRLTGCSTWASGPAVDRIVALCPATRQTLFFSATLDGEAGRVAREYTDDAGRSTNVARRPVAPAPISSTASSRSRTRTASTRSSASCAATASSRSCSCEPSTAPTGSSSGSALTAWRRSRCTATSHSVSASRRSRGSNPAQSTRSWPPTSRPAGSTSAGSHTSSTSIRPPTARPTFTGSAGLAAPVRRASASRWSDRPNITTSSRLATQLGLEHGLSRSPGELRPRPADTSPTGQRPRRRARRPRPAIQR